MSCIKGKNTKPEEYIRKLLFSEGYRYRKNVSYVVGHPDIWMPKYNLAIFINGCFWHRHKNCRYAYVPKSNVEFWTKKFNQNVMRDKKVREELLEKKIRCLTIWECTIREMKRFDEAKNRYLSMINEFINSDEKYKEI